MSHILRLWLLQKYVRSEENFIILYAPFSRELLLGFLVLYLPIILTIMSKKLPQKLPKTYFNLLCAWLLHEKFHKNAAGPSILGIEHWGLTLYIGLKIANFFIQKKYFFQFSWKLFFLYFFLNFFSIRLQLK